MDAAQLMDMAASVVSRYRRSSLPACLSAEDLRQECFAVGTGYVGSSPEEIRGHMQHRAFILVRRERGEKVNIAKFMRQCTGEMSDRTYRATNTITDPWLLCSLGELADRQAAWEARRGRRERSMEDATRCVRKRLGQMAICEGYRQ